MTRPLDHRAPNEDAPLTRAGFLGGLLGALGLVAMSVVGTGHSRQVQGAANIEFWIVVALVAAAATSAAIGLARTAAASPLGEIVRKVTVAAAAVAIVLFVWETVALGAGLRLSPYAVLMSLSGR